MAPHDEEAYAPINNNDNDHDDDHHHTPYNADAYGSVNSNTMFDSSTSYGGGQHLQQQHQSDPFADSSYGGAQSTYSDHGYGRSTPYNGGHQASGSQIYAAPSAEEEYDDGRPARFPAANYDRTLH